ncbi:MAG: PAS domain S-box protein [Deltaproteobacteria bacterium]|nr:PAS domain S-box protein [Deltaproteobacteria bacterium]
MKKRVLIVDDNLTNRYLLETLLQAEGIETTSAENGRVALESAQAAPPDLIISDILMPVMDGYLLCRNCKADERLRRVPFFFYTATYTEPKDEAFALSLGAERFILKPQEPETLLQMAQEIWDRPATAEPEPQPPRPLGEEMEFFRHYNEVLFAKLEKKLLDLETAHEKLKCLEEQYRLSFENVTDIVWTLGTDFIVRKMSPSVERMLGYQPQDFIGRSASEVVKILAPDALERAMGDISLVLQGRTIPAAVYSLVTKDGAVKTGEISAAPMLSKGNIVGLVSVVRNITERKQAEETLRESENRFRHLFEHMSSAAATYEAVDEGRDFVFRDFNAAAEQLEKIKREELLGKRVTEIFPGVRDFGLLEVFLRVWRTGVSEDHDVSLYRDQRIAGWRENHVYKLPSGEIVAIYDDVTVRKRMEESLLLQQERLDLAQIAGKVGIFDWDMVADRSQWTPQLRAIYGIEPGSGAVTSDDWSKLVHPRDVTEARLAVQRCILAKLPEIEGDYRIVHPDGEVRWLSNRAKIFYDSTGKPLRMVGTSVDITERKQAEEALRESEEKYHFLFDNLQDAVLLTKPDGSILEANQAACEMFGRTVEELRAVGRNGVTDVNDPCLQAALAERARTGSVVADLTMHRADGKTFLAVVRSNVYKDADGDQKTSMIIRDVTEHRKAEAALQESENRYRSLFQDHSAVKFIIDPDTGSIVEANAAAARYYGWSREQLLQMKIQEINTLSPEAVGSEMEKAQGQKQIHYEFRHRRADGSIRDVEVFSSTIEGKGKSLLHSIIHDITERKRAQDALQGSEENFRRSLDESPLGIRIVSPGSETVYVNQATLDIFGVDSFAEWQETPVTSRYSEKSYADSLVRNEQRRSAEDGPAEYEIEIVRNDGEVRHLQVWRKKITWNGAEHYEIIYLDITDRLRAMEELQKAKAQLLQSEKLAALGRLSAGVAHEILNPVNVISLALQMLMINGETTPQAKQKLGMCIEQTGRIVAIAEDLKQFSRVKEKRLALGDITGLVNHVLEFSRPQLKMNGIETEVQFGDELPATLMDAARIEQVLLNLITNAADAMEGKKEKTLRITIGRTRTDEGKDCLKLAVADTGSGIRQENLNQCFEPFFTTKPPGKGTGLGLSISFGIIEDHGGRIWAENNEKGGATFCFEVPIVPDKTAEAS